MALLDGLKSGIEQAVNLLRNKTSQGTDTLFKLVKELWDKSENYSNIVNRAKDYWDGKLLNSLQANIYFPDQSKSNFNIIKSISEIKLKNMLDAQFTISVTPDYGAFYDISAIKDTQDVADILTDLIHKIEKDNKMDIIDEQVGRYGGLCGYGASQVEWCDKIRADGDVKINFIPSEDIRWNIGAKQDNVSMIAFQKEYTPAEAKEMFAKDNMGNYDPDLCRTIDEISEIVTGKDHRNQTGAVLNYVNTSNNTGGRAFIEAGNDGIQAGKKVILITMYLIDDSVYAPEEKDSTEVEQAKEEYKRVFPNGRKIVFSLNESKKIILLDEPLSKSFKNLGNIDIYNYIYTTNLKGESAIEEIIPIQDRINGLFYKYREKVSHDFDTLFGPDDLFEGDNSIVKSGYTKITGYNANKMPVFVTSNGINKAMEILQAIEIFIKGAYELAHVNEIMTSGIQPKGVSSGEQIERLQESPMVDIRSQQRNFKLWKIAVAEKCLKLVLEKYDTQRIVCITSGIDKNTFAKFDTDLETKQRYIQLFEQVGDTIKEIKKIMFNDNWKFKVDVIAGTEIPRSRKENAELTDKIANAPIMQTGNIPLIDMYLQALDYPNRRSVVKLLKEQQEQMAANPQPMTLETIIKNPEICKAIADLFKSLQGFSKAQGQMLEMVGLNADTDTLTSAPAQHITSKSQAKDIASIIPQQISENPEQIKFGNERATEIEKIRALKGGIA